MASVVRWKTATASGVDLSVGAVVILALSVASLASLMEKVALPCAFVWARRMPVAPDMSVRLTPLRLGAMCAVTL